MGWERLFEVWEDGRTGCEDRWRLETGEEVSSSSSEEEVIIQGRVRLEPILGLCGVLV
jgi:hypothetical protein